MQNSIAVHDSGHGKPLPGMPLAVVDMASGPSLAAFLALWTASRQFPADSRQWPVIID